jgi:hypothetical protein
MTEKSNFHFWKNRPVGQADLSQNMPGEGTEKQNNFQAR